MCDLFVVRVHQAKMDNLVAQVRKVHLDLKVRCRRLPISFFLLQSLSFCFAGQPGEPGDKGPPGEPGKVLNGAPPGKTAILRPKWPCWQFCCTFRPTRTAWTAWATRASRKLLLPALLFA